MSTFDVNDQERQFNICQNYEICLYDTYWLFKYLDDIQKNDSIVHNSSTLILLQKDNCANVCVNIKQEYLPIRYI